MKYCPKCGEKVKPLQEYPSNLFLCEKDKIVFREVRVGFRVLRWELVE